jgi:hypothetical protein
VKLKAAVLLLLLGRWAPAAQAYSVLSHEVVIDLLWADTLQPLLLQRFPGASPDELRRAHAYAYGGSIIQDMGYYPFGNREFSDLVHYVRSGDFVLALLRDAADLDEYAFALGALAHYAADTEGHPAVNQAVAQEIPELGRRYGPSVTYEDNPKAHIRVEFGFDVTQVAKRRFPSDSYRDLIGFEVSQTLLERAFRETYGLELKTVLKHEDLAVGSYRRAVSKVIPMFTRAAVATHRAELVREIPDFNRRKFIYRMTQAEYRQNWGRNYQRPGLGSRILALLFRLVPKVGPFRAVDFTTPTPQTEDLYFRSMNQTAARYRAELGQLRAGALPELPNRDFDTGRETRAGEYRLTDESYARLLHSLAQGRFQTVTPALRANLLDFFADPSALRVTKRDKDKWQRTQQELQALKGGHDQPAVGTGH